MSQTVPGAKLPATLLFGEALYPAKHGNTDFLLIQGEQFDGDDQGQNSNGNINEEHVAITLARGRE